MHGQRGNGDAPAESYVVRFPPGEAGRQAVRQTFARARFDLSYTANVKGVLENS